jgi:hypothetical protein
VAAKEKKVEMVRQIDRDTMRLRGTKVWCSEIIKQVKKDGTAAMEVGVDLRQLGKDKTRQDKTRLEKKQTEGEEDEDEDEEDRYSQVSTTFGREEKNQEVGYAQLEERPPGRGPGTGGG